MALGERVREARENIAKMSQKALADRCGVTQQAISLLESRDTEGSKSVFAIASALNVNPYWLQTGEGAPDKAPYWLVGELLRGHITQEMVQALRDAIKGTGDDLAHTSTLAHDALGILTVILNSAPEKPKPAHDPYDDSAMLTEIAEQTGVNFNPHRERENAADQPAPANVDIDDLTGKLRQTYHGDIQECTEKLMQLRAENRYLARQNRPIEERRKVLSEIRVTETMRRCYREAVMNIALIEDELGV